MRFYQHLTPRLKLTLDFLASLTEEEIRGGSLGPLWGRGGEEGKLVLSSPLSSSPIPHLPFRATRLLLLCCERHDDASKRKA